MFGQRHRPEIIKLHDPAVNVEPRIDRKRPLTDPCAMNEDVDVSKAAENCFGGWAERVSVQNIERQNKMLVGSLAGSLNTTQLGLASRTQH